MINNSWQNWR